MTDRIPILIIGDGYAAGVFALHLLEAGVDASRLAILGPGRLGRGKAYGCENPDFRLNVRDDLMMLRPDDSKHFATWAEKHIDDPNAQTHAGRFFRRQDFARYLISEIDRTLRGKELRQIRDRAVKIHAGACWHVTTSDKRELLADTVVLTPGNPEPQPTFPISDDISGALINNAWKGTWTSDIDKDNDVTVIGGGLTAMDAIYTLEQRGHLGRINVITPVGILPPAQTDWVPKHPYPWPKSISGSEFLATFRRQLGQGDWTDPDWQSSFESLRPQISSSWQSLTHSERRRLKHKLGWWWQLIRYRASPQTVAAAERLKASGQLRLYHGRCRAIEGTHLDTARITVALADATTSEFTTDHVLIATGAGKDPLLAEMILSGLISGEAGGLTVDSNFNIIGPNGVPLEGIYAFGPPVAFSLGDVVGASSIGRQAFQLAHRLEGEST
ncbi:MAG: hypothetical protein EBZ18_01730 [Alphaproteobacteria bacterium]|nr:hypothetical protein [Alphaproteobacteria bacterium]